MPKETAKRKASKVKKSLAIKAESPPPNSSVKQIVPAPVADVGVDTSLNAAPLDMDDEDNRVAVSVGVDSSDDTDPSVSEGRLSSVVDDVIPDAVEVLLAQYETRAPSYGLSLPAQMEQDLPSQPFERFGSTVGSSFVRSTQSDLPIADQYREISEQAAHGQGSTVHPQEARIHRVPTSRKRRIGMLPQDVSSFILPSTTSGTTHKNQQRTQIHGRRMNVAHRPSRIHNAVRATQVPAPQPSPPPRPSAPKISSFGGSSSGFSGLDSMNPSWAADVFWNNPQNMEYNSVYTEVADPNALFTSSANTSFSSESTDSSFEGQGSGLHMDYQNDPSQMFIPSNLQEQRAQDEFLRQQYSTFLSSSIFDTSSADPAMQMYPYPYTGPGSMADASMGFETKYNHFAPGPERQR